MGKLRNTSYVMTDKRAEALKKGKIVRDYCNVIGKLNIIIRDMESSIPYIKQSYHYHWLKVVAETLQENENGVRKTIGVCSREEGNNKRVAELARKATKQKRKLNNDLFF